MIARRRFGRTDLEIPRITFGGGWVGGLLIHQDQETAFAALDRAVAAGIDWIDTAALYGNGVSETVIGAWLGARPETQLSGISTKFRIDPALPDLRGQMLRSVEQSMQRLGRSSVDVIIQHNKFDASGGYDAAMALLMAETMQELKEQGLCRFTGMTALGDTTGLQQVVSSGGYDCAQVYYNALNPSAAGHIQGAWNTTDFAGLLQDCVDQDMGVMGIRIFAAGHLATDQRHGREIPVTENASDAAEAARAQAMRNAMGETYGTPAQAALRFGLACDALSTIVVGLGEADHLEQVIEAAGQGALPQQALEHAARVRTGPEFTV